MGGCVVLCVFVAGGGLRRGGAEARRRGDAEAQRRGGAETRRGGGIGSKFKTWQDKYKSFLIYWGRRKRGKGSVQNHISFGFMEINNAPRLVVFPS